METALELFGIDILNCDSIDIQDDSIQYNDVRFCIESLKKYNGSYIQVFYNGKFNVWNEEGEVIDQFYLIENDEFKKMLFKKYPVIDM